ncbi:MAG: S4 domain-containing protein [Pseudomonadota bacterium]
MSDAPTQRLDRWIWHARFAKTRAVAQGMISKGRIRVNKTKVTKPGYPVGPGDVLTISRSGWVDVVTIEDVAEKRGSATVAATLYTKEESG